MPALTTCPSTVRSWRELLSAVSAVLCFWLQPQEVPETVLSLDEVEVLNKLEIEFSDKISDKMTYLRTKQAEMGMRYPEAAFLYPMVTDHERIWKELNNIRRVRIFMSAIVLYHHAFSTML